MKGLTYSRCGDYYIPDLKLSEQAGTPIGKYGRMRKRYLEKHRPIFYNNLILTGRLYPHLLEIDKAANERMDTLMPQLMEAAGVDEALKAADQIRWVQVDDGYRAIYLYYQRDNLAYPIEVQLWCGKDYYFNLWSHQYVYKYKSPEIGRQLYLEYAAGEVKTEWEFQKRLQELEVTDNG